MTTRFIMIQCRVYWLWQLNFCLRKFVPIHTLSHVPHRWILSARSFDWLSAHHPLRFFYLPFTVLTYGKCIHLAVLARGAVKYMSSSLSNSLTDVEIKVQGRHFTKISVRLHYSPLAHSRTNPVTEIWVSQAAVRPCFAGTVKCCCCASWTSEHWCLRLHIGVT